ncbi:MAG: DUF1298 domain-containing protein [Actinobacteria bacterium]|nr:DUF1298 domain-containing protein [Actinomycetota bacterium]
MSTTSSSADNGSSSQEKGDKPKAHRVSGWDFATWRSASDAQMLRSTMMAVYVLDRAPDWDRLVSRYDRATRLSPVLRMKMVEGPVAIANPRLVVDEHFDLSFHMSRFSMPEGSTWKDVLDEARREAMMDFDRNRSLWHVTVLEGLPGGKAVLLFKLHHAIADGQKGMEIGAALIDLTEEETDLGPMPDAPEAGDLSSKRDFGRTMIQDNAEWVAKTATRVAKGAVPATVQAIKSPVETAGKVGGAAKSLAKFTQQPSAPASPIMTKRSVNYHFGAFEFPFQDLRGAAKAGGHTVNDAFLAAVAEGMRRYHDAHNAPVEALHISMPISTRKPGGGGGNAVGIAHFDLKLSTPNAETAMDEIHEIVQKWRQEPVIGMSNQLGEVSRFLPTDMVLSAATSSDVTASNVPGPPLELWIAGAKIEHMVPFPPLIGAAVFVAMLTYDKQAAIGLSMDDAAVPDRDELLRCMAEGFSSVTGKPIEVGGFLSEE